MSTAQSPRPDDTPRTTSPIDPRGESPWARMVLVALVVGGLFWSVAALLDPDDGTPRQFLSAVLCAGAALAVQYVLGLAPRAARSPLDEHTRRVEAALADNTAAVRDGLSRYDDELKSGLTRHTQDVKQLVETHVAQADHRSAESARTLDPVRIDRLPDLAEGFADVLLPNPSILHTFVRLEMSRVVGHMADLTNLSAECPGENHDWMLTLTRAAEHSILATSTSVDREFWNSEPAGRYLDAQQAAIDEQGVSVRRLFLLGSARELDDRLLRLCEEQELRRIDVRVAVLPELPPHLQRGTTNDFILYDEEVSFEIEQDLRDVNVRTRLTARQEYVRDRLKRFRELWDAGMGLRELEVRVDDEEDGNWMVDRA
ncbi:hypothetical protein [Streptomyces sp. NPDC005930]|uniref:hypothetical protein n=1 Tax=Streptomyces sp. NPDC005930 TaxID=3364736 RepID=UPI0036C12600